MVRLNEPASALKNLIKALPKTKDGYRSSSTKAEMKHPDTAFEANLRIPPSVLVNIYLLISVMMPCMLYKLVLKLMLLPIFM